MIIELYGDGGLFQSMIAAECKVSHIDTKFNFEVVKVDDVGAKFKEAVKKTYDAKFLDDADAVVRFAIPKEPVQEEPPQETDGQEGEQDGDKTEQTDGQEGEQENVSESTFNPSAGKFADKVGLGEAETTATGVDLKKKMIECIKRAFKVEDENNIELSDLDGFIEGYDVAFVKLSLKDHE